MARRSITFTPSPNRFVMRGISRERNDQLLMIVAESENVRLDLDYTDALEPDDFIDHVCLRSEQITARLTHTETMAHMVLANATLPLWWPGYDYGICWINFTGSCEIIACTRSGDNITTFLNVRGPNSTHTARNRLMPVNPHVVGLHEQSSSRDDALSSDLTAGRLTDIHHPEPQGLTSPDHIDRPGVLSRIPDTVPGDVDPLTIARQP